MSHSGVQAEEGKASLLEILVVEDSSDHCELIRRAFAESKMSVATTFCSSLAGAREILAESSPDLVLADVRLPDGRGKELLQVEGADIPLVLMTSFGDETQAVAAIKAGALDYVVKTDESFRELPAICWRAVRDWRVHASSIEARRALEVSESRYRTLFQNLPAGIFQCDMAGNLITVNKFLVRMLAYPDEAAMSGLELVGEVIKQQDGLRDLAELVGPDNAENLEVTLHRYDGGESIAMMGLQPVKKSKGVCCYEGFFIDLTQQRESDRKLAETTLRFEAAFKNIHGFMALVDDRGNVLDISDSIVNATGTQRADVCGKPAWDAPWWQDAPAEVEAIKSGINAALNGEVTRDQTKFRTRDGRIREGDRSFSPVFDSEGKLRFVVVEGIDISDLMTAQRRLAASELQFRSLFESATEALVVFDVQRRAFVDLNKNMEKMFGGSKEQLLGMTALDLSPEIQPDGGLSAERARDFMRLARAGEAPIFEWTFKTLAGESIDCEVRLNRVPDNRRELIRGSITDISKRKQAEMQLRNSEQRMSALIENAASGILEIDRGGSVVSANPAAVAMYGHNESAEIIGSTFLNYVPRRDRKRTKDALDNAWRGHDSSLDHPVAGGSQDRFVSSSFAAIRAGDGVVSRVIIMCDDITEREANAARLENERRFTNAVINSLPGTFFVFSEDGKLVRYNDRFLSTNGYSASEARGLKPLDLIYSGHRDKAAVKIRELFTTGETAAEADLMTKNGRRIPMSYSGRLLTQGGKRFMVGFGMDISERRRNEKRFLAEKKFAETVINSMPGVFYVVNANRRIVRWNENLLTLLGKKAEEIATLEPMSVVAEADREVVEEGLRKVFQEGEARVEAKFIMASGEERPFILTGVRLMTENSAYMVGMGFDISERKHYEAQLRSSENYLRSIVESEPECVWTLDRAGRLVDINPAGRLLLGDSVVEVARASSIAGLIPPGQREAFLQLNESVFAGHSGILTFELETEGGNKRWLETHAVALRDETGQIERHLAVTRDITEKKSADSKIRNYSDRLEKLSQRLLATQEAERRHLARELHDEVGQSLTALKLNLESGGFGEARTSPRFDDSLKIIDTVLEQVRDLSLDLRPAILDDLGLLPALRWYVDRQAKRGNLAARLEADTLTGVRLQSEVETATFRIVQEAMTNVLRHAAARTVRIRIEITDDRVAIEVNDDGAGFDAFKTLRHAARGGSFGLTGLKERAALLGGEAHVSSSPGRGTQVSAWMPLPPLHADNASGSDSSGTVNPASSDEQSPLKKAQM